MLNLAKLFVIFGCFSLVLSLDLLEIKKSGEDREPEPEPEPVKQTGVPVALEEREFGETLLTLYRLDNSSLFEEVSPLSERSETLELKYKNRNSLDITKAFHNQIEDAKKKRSILSLLYIDLQLEKETELLGFIQDFNSISLIAFQNISQQCQMIVDNCNTLGIIANMGLGKDLFLNSGHSCLSQYRSRSGNSIKSMDKSMLLSFESESIVAIYRCLCSALQFNLALKNEKNSNEFFLEMSDIEYNSMIISFKILRHYVLKTYQEISVGEARSNKEMKINNQFNSLSQKVQVLVDISDFLSRTTSYDALATNLACTEYSVSNPLNVLQLNFKRFLHTYLNYREQLQLEFPIDSRMVRNVPNFILY